MRSFQFKLTKLLANHLKSPLCKRYHKAICELKATLKAIFQTTFCDRFSCEKTQLYLHTCRPNSLLPHQYVC